MPVSVMILLAMVLGTAGIAGYRKFVAREEDDIVHLGPDATEFRSHQVHTNQTLERLDKYGKAMTALTGVYALAVFVWFLYQELTSRGAL